MTDEIYKPHTFGLSIRIPNEIMEDDPYGYLYQMMKNQARLTQMRMEIQMGMGLSPDDAKFLLAKYDAALEVAQSKPAPTMLNTLRRWLAAKIRPAYDDYDD